jgi:hypothetical protein
MCSSVRSGGCGVITVQQQAVTCNVTALLAWFLGQCRFFPPVASWLPRPSRPSFVCHVCTCLCVCICTCVYLCVAKPSEEQSRPSFDCRVYVIIMVHICNRDVYACMRTANADSRPSFDYRVYVIIIVYVCTSMYSRVYVCAQAKASEVVKVESEWDMPEPKADDSDSDDDNAGGYSPVLDQVCYFCIMCMYCASVADSDSDDDNAGACLTSYATFIMCIYLVWREHRVRRRR